jgi:hypothetical protein
MNTNDFRAVGTLLADDYRLEFWPEPFGPPEWRRAWAKGA